jgi:hypothetical protein
MTDRYSNPSARSHPPLNKISPTSLLITEKKLNRESLLLGHLEVQNRPFLFYTFKKNRKFLPSIKGFQRVTNNIGPKKGFN